MARVLVLEEIDGWSDWVQPDPTGFRFFCCDCALGHDMQFRRVRRADGVYRVQFRVSRNRRATAAKRREEKKRAKP